MSDLLAMLDAAVEEVQEELDPQIPEVDNLKHIQSILDQEGKRFSQVFSDNYLQNLLFGGIDSIPNRNAPVEERIGQGIIGHKRKSLLFEGVEEAKTALEVVDSYGVLAKAVEDLPDPEEKIENRYNFEWSDSDIFSHKNTNVLAPSYRDPVKKFLPLDPIATKYTQPILDNLELVQNLITSANSISEIRNLLMLNAIGRELEDRTTFDEIINTPEINPREALQRILGVDDKWEHKVTSLRVGIENLIYDISANLDETLRKHEMKVGEITYEIRRNFTERTGLYIPNAPIFDLNEDVEDYKEEFLEQLINNGLIEDTAAKRKDRHDIRKRFAATRIVPRYGGGYYYEHDKNDLKDGTIGVLHDREGDFLLPREGNLRKDHYRLARDEIIVLKDFIPPGVLGDSRRKKIIEVGDEVKDNHGNIGVVTEDTMDHDTLGVEYTHYADGTKRDRPANHREYRTDIKIHKKKKPSHDDLIEEVYEELFPVGSDVNITEGSRFYKEDRKTGQILRKSLFEDDTLPVVVSFPDGTINNYSYEDFDVGENTQVDLEARLNELLEKKNTDAEKFSEEMGVALDSSINEVLERYNNLADTRKRLILVKRDELTNTGVISQDHANVILNSRLENEADHFPKKLETALKFDFDYQSVADEIKERIMTQNGIIIPNYFVDTEEDLKYFIDSLENRILLGYKLKDENTVLQPGESEIVYIQGMKQNEHYGEFFKDRLVKLFYRVYGDGKDSRVLSTNLESELFTTTELSLDDMEYRSVERLLTKVRFKRENKEIKVGDKVRYRDSYIDTAFRKDYLDTRRPVYSPGVIGKVIKETDSRLAVQFSKDQMNKEWDGRTYDRPELFNNSGAYFRRGELEHVDLRELKDENAKIYLEAVEALPDIIRDSKSKYTEAIGKYNETVERITVENFFLGYSAHFDQDDLTPIKF